MLVARVELESQHRGVVGLLTYDACDGDLHQTHLYEQERARAAVVVIGSRLSALLLRLVDPEATAARRVEKALCLNCVERCRRVDHLAVGTEHPRASSNRRHVTLMYHTPLLVEHKPASVLHLSVSGGRQV